MGSGSGKFRYGSNASTSNYTQALGAGLHAIYREQPTVTRAVGDQTITYGDALPTFTFTTSGGRNGDTSAAILGQSTAPTVTVGGSLAASGFYTAGAHTLSASGGDTTSPLGYAFNASTTPGTLTITPKPLLLTALSDSKAYDGSTASRVLPRAGGLVPGDTLTGLAQSFDSSAPGARTLNVSSYTINDGHGGANYAVTLVPASGRITAQQPPPPPVVGGPRTGGNTDGGQGTDTSVPAGDPADAGSDRGTNTNADTNANAGTGSAAGTGGGLSTGIGSPPAPETGSLATTPGVRVVLVRDMVQGQQGLTRVHVPPEVLRTATGFAFVLTLPPFEGTEALPTATLRDGSALPVWLLFDARVLRFTVRQVPPDGLPLTVRVQRGPLVMEVDLFESAQP